MMVAWHVFVSVDPTTDPSICGPGYPAGPPIMHRTIYPHIIRTCRSSLPGELLKKFAQAYRSFQEADEAGQIGVRDPVKPEVAQLSPCCCGCRTGAEKP